MLRTVLANKTCESMEGAQTLVPGTYLAFTLLFQMAEK